MTVNCDKSSRITTGELKAILEFARQILEGSGEIALRYFRQTMAVENKMNQYGFDPVTRADREIEAYLRDQLQRRFPDDGIIGEEQDPKQSASGLCWVIDPIDGTKAFISGHPTWGILLGLMEGDEPIAGLMFQPFTGELYEGSAYGSMLWRNQSATDLTTRKITELDQATLYCTHESMFPDQKHLTAFRRVSSLVKLQRFGGDCYSYCLLAHGLIDLIIEDTLQPYDIIPLIPIVESAGGLITNIHGESASAGGFVIAAATPELHGQAMKVLHQSLNG